MKMMGSSFEFLNKPNTTTLDYMVVWSQEHNNVPLWIEETYHAILPGA
jgi:hypothetical protein